MTNARAASEGTARAFQKYDQAGERSADRA